MVNKTEPMHCHKCEKCGTIWEHPDSCADGTIEDMRKYHKCPDCGTDERHKHYPRNGETIKYHWEGVNTNA